MSTVPFALIGLPTPIANTASRVNVLGEDASADTFLAVSYVFEAFLKTIVVALQSGLATRHREHAYKIGYAIVRADGLGVWQESLQMMTKPPVSGFIPTEMVGLLQWATAKNTKPTDQWARDAFDASQRILAALDADMERPTKLTVGHLLSACVQIRNKTKAHGAVGEDFYRATNSDYVAVVAALLGHCPAMTWTWARVYRTPTRALRVVHLAGTSPEAMPDSAARPFQSVDVEGIYLAIGSSGHPFTCAALLQSDRQCKNFFWPNGGFAASTSKAEFLDYATGVTKGFDIAEFVTPPAPLPASETHSEFTLDVHSNVYANFPPLPERYVQRTVLQDELLTRLRDKNHPILTLHGRGGVGKTYLALYAAHSLSGSATTPFDCIVWLSARDIDLRTTGPASVRQDVMRLDDICRAVGDLFEIKRDLEGFAALLHDPSGHATDGTGILFILDNFETLAEVREIHKFLDTHTHLPNKVLITSRERAFKADYPIEVRGMEFDEAAAMLRETALDLGITDLMDATRIQELYEYTDGHAYAMRVLAGEMAKERRNVPLKSVLPKRLDIVQAVFERSFNKLTESGRRIFMVVSGFRSVISELALLVVLGQRDIDVEYGLDECLRLSLIEAVELADGTAAYIAPQLARIFAQKKLDGDPDRLVIQEDLETIREFGVIHPGQREAKRQTDAVESFVKYCRERAHCETSELRLRVASMLEAVAEFWPVAWLDLYEFHESHNGNFDDKAYALRRAVEEMPYNKDAWIKRSKFAGDTNDTPTRIAALVSAVDADPSDVKLLRYVAHEVAKYVNDHLNDIPKARRGVYLASVRAHMEKVPDELDPTGLSRLAWLFLLEGDRDSAWRYANMGCARDSANAHCLSILERLDAEGYQP